MRDTDDPGHLKSFRSADEIVMPARFKMAYVKAGFPSPAQDFMEEEIDLVAFFGMDKPSTVILRVCGGDLMDDHLPEGAYLVVDQSLTPVSQDLVLVIVNQDYTLKTLVKSANGYLLYSSNPYIPPYSGQSDDVAIVGVVAQIIIDKTRKRSIGTYGHLIKQETDLFQLLGVHKPSVFLFRTDGHSMKDQHIPNDSYLIVDRSLHPQANDTVIACLNGEFTVKMLVKSVKNWVLYPGNPYYPPIQVKDTDDFSIWGIVSKVVIDRKSLRKGAQ